MVNKALTGIILSLFLVLGSYVSASADDKCSGISEKFSGIFNDHGVGSENILHDLDAQSGMAAALLNSFNEGELEYFEEECANITNIEDSVPDLPAAISSGGCSYENWREDYGEIADSEELNVYISSIRNAADADERQKFQEDYIRANRLATEGRLQESCDLVGQLRAKIGL